MIAIIKTNAQQGAFRYAGFRTNPHRHIANQLQSELNEHNPALEPACRPCFAEAPQRHSRQVYHQLSIFDQQQYQAEVTQNISTAESPGR